MGTFIIILLLLFAVSVIVVSLIGGGEGKEKEKEAKPPEVKSAPLPPGEAIRRPLFGEEVKRPLSGEELHYRQGNDFEEYVIGLFDPGRYMLIHRTPRHDETGGRFVESMRYPDLRFRDRHTGRGFWVECKWRSHPGPQGEITWCNEKQMREYRRAGRMTGERVYVMLGIGGTPSHPRELYLMDIRDIPWCTLFRGTYVRHRYTRERVSEIRDL